MDELNLRATPTVNLSAPDSANRMAEALVAESRRVDADPTVVEAWTAFENAEARQDELDGALSALNVRYSEIDKWLKDIAPAYVEELIKSAASGGRRPDQKVAGQIIDRENEVRLLVRAVQRIVEHLKPTAQIARLWAEAAHQFARAKVLDRLAHERAQRLLDSLSAAVSEEGVVQVDAKAGVSGLLLGMASEARTTAHGHERLAKELQEKYNEQTRKDN
jgi:hypothetical protein